MPTQLKGGHASLDPRLGRVSQFDDRSRGYPIRDLLYETQLARPRGYTWKVPVRLNQRSEPACVGFAVAQEAAARPVTVAGIDDAAGLDVYRRAQQLDEWPGDAYPGTSVLAGMKAGVERGWYEEYRWAFGLDDVVLAVGYRGPCVLGLNWYRGMMSTDGLGFVRAEGDLVGGHAILCNGVSVRDRRLRLTNSWGVSFGWDGQCWISFADLDRLLREGGEAAVPVRRAGR